MSFKNINALNAGKFDNRYNAYRGALIQSGMTAPGINNIKRLYGPIFYRQKDLTSWELNTYFDKLEVIGDDVFYGCPGLTELSLPNVISIGEKAFSGCTNLTTLYLPRANIIGARAFENCTALQSLGIPNVSIIIGGAFRGCTKISSVNLPNIRRIGISAFYECNFQHLDLGENLEKIDDFAFITCTGLYNVFSKNMTPPLYLKKRFRAMSDIKHYMCRKDLYNYMKQPTSGKNSRPF